MQQHGTAVWGSYLPFYSKRFMGIEPATRDRLSTCAVSKEFDGLRELQCTIRTSINVATTVNTKAIPTVKRIEETFCSLVQETTRTISEESQQSDRNDGGLLLAFQHVLNALSRSTSDGVGLVRRIEELVL